ncbi:hypothetical protein DENSPDRAFT_885009, partial [Dentipellis sp. KUC8613]
MSAHHLTLASPSPSPSHTAHSHQTPPKNCTYKPRRRHVGVRGAERHKVAMGKFSFFFFSCYYALFAPPPFHAPRRPLRPSPPPAPLAAPCAPRRPLRPSPRRLDAPCDPRRAVSTPSAAVSCPPPPAAL